MDKNEKKENIGWMLMGEKALAEVWDNKKF